MSKERKAIRKIPYFECERCGITTETIDRMCPCPRGSCEAVHKGTVVVTRTIELISINERAKAISEAHKRICRRKGFEYAPTSQEIETEIDKIINQK